ncbi:MAG: triose-phosphate isomerase, partial [Aquificota bacterium]
MKLIAANWKMNLTPSQSKEYIQRFLPLVEGIKDREILLCPPFTSLCIASELLKDSHVKLGAQNCHYEPKGAFTGEVSIAMLKELGVSYVIVGHSERRWIFGEKDELINKKLTACLREGIRPILCVGERIEEKEAGLTLKVVETQIRLALSGIEEYTDNLDIAYEPVWAIGSGNPATPEDAQLVHAFIKELLHQINPSHQGKTRVLYG